MTLSEGPYAAAATTYFGRGVGSPLPVPPRAKKSPPTGYTGYQGLRPSMADVTEWALNGKGIGNVVLRLVETVIGIDVDAYGSKPGLETLEAMEASLGALPATFVSTSRPLPSGIRFYRVPAGRVWADVVGPGIEVIHYGHRYAVVAPSIHPDTGAQYVWLRDGVVVAGPSLADLPPLPPAWVAYLDRGDISTRSTKADVGYGEATDILAGYPVGEPCPWLVRVLDDAGHELGRAASRHDTVRKFIGIVVRAGEQGHVGSSEALSQLGKMWTDAMQTGEKRTPDPDEYERMVIGAVALVLDSPTAPEDKGCCGSAAGDTSGLDFDPGTIDGLDTFWDARPILRHVERFARAKVVSPWAVLGVVLCRVVCRTRHEIVLPDIIGSYGSLNLFVALVGASGIGKGAAERCAKRAVTFGQQITQAGLGSGEGICHLYAHREVKDKVSTVVRHEYSVLFSVPEVDTLGALGARQGATLLPELRKAWSGEQLGMAYADPQKRLPIEEYTYRMGLVMGVQPLRAGEFLADVGGTPHRFLWLPAADRHLPDVAPPVPPVWVWSPPTGRPSWNLDGLGEMAVPDVARNAILDARRRIMREAMDPLDGHKLQCQLKVAAAFALLDSRYEITEEDWSLAERMMEVSGKVRDSVQATLIKAATESSEARARARGHEAVVIDATIDEAVTGRCRERVLKLLGKKDWTPLRDLKHRVSKPQREHLEPVLVGLVESGTIEHQDGDSNAGDLYRKK